jgi:mxaA protein
MRKIILIYILLLPVFTLAQEKATEVKAANAAIAEFTVHTEDPRPFGYVIGDELSRRIEIDAPSTFKLQSDSLPRPGRVDAWLELRKINVTEKVSGSNTRHMFDLRYQILNSPENVKTHSLAKLLIIFNNNNQLKSVEIAESPLTVSPITPAFVLARDGLEEMRADKTAKLIDASVHYWRLGFTALAAAAALLSLIYVKWGMPFLRKHNGPFARARRDIHKINATDTSSAFRRLHRAFDETAGVRIFPQHLAEFFTRHPAFADVQTDAQKFFTQSRVAFFSKEAESDKTINKKWLLDFCARCRDRERGMQ